MARLAGLRPADPVFTLPRRAGPHPVSRLWYSRLIHAGCLAAGVDRLSQWARPREPEVVIDLETWRQLRADVENQKREFIEEGKRRQILEHVQRGQAGRDLAQVPAGREAQRLLAEENVEEVEGRTATTAAPRLAIIAAAAQ